MLEWASDPGFPLQSFTQFVIILTIRGLTHPVRSRAIPWIELRSESLRPVEIKDLSDGPIGSDEHGVSGLFKTSVPPRRVEATLLMLIAAFKSRSNTSPQESQQ